MVKKWLNFIPQRANFPKEQGALRKLDQFSRLTIEPKEYSALPPATTSEHNCNLRRQNRYGKQCIALLGNSETKFHICLPFSFEGNVRCMASEGFQFKIYIAANLPIRTNPVMVNNGIEKERQKRIIRAD